MTRVYWIKRIAIAALVVEVIYVILFNLALQLPLTQSLINQIKPDKFHVSWENAWTWYPFRFHMQTVFPETHSHHQPHQPASSSILIDWIDHLASNLHFICIYGSPIPYTYIYIPTLFSLQSLRTFIL